MPKISKGQRIARRIGQAVYDLNRATLEQAVAAADFGGQRAAEAAAEQHSDGEPRALEEDAE